MIRRDAHDLLPLTPAMFHVLVALADGETHGYAIMKDVEELTGGGVRLSTGTLYGIIKRLLADGLIRESYGQARSAARTGGARMRSPHSAATSHALKRRASSTRSRSPDASRCFAKRSAGSTIG